MAESEKGIYTPGTITVENSMNFMKSYLKVSRFIDSKYNIGFTDFLITDISKYSYPVLYVQRNKGISTFWEYGRLLEKEIQINKTFYYHIYFWGLLIFNKPICDKIIMLIKKVVGKTPKL